MEWPRQESSPSTESNRTIRRVSAAGALASTPPSPLPPPLPVGGAVSGAGPADGVGATAGAGRAASGGSVRADAVGA